MGCIQPKDKSQVRLKPSDENTEINIQDQSTININQTLDHSHSNPNIVKSSKDKIGEHQNYI